MKLKYKHKTRCRRCDHGFHWYGYTKEDLRKVLSGFDTYSGPKTDLSEECSICTTTAWDEPRYRLGSGYVCSTCIETIKEELGLVDTQELLSMLEEEEDEKK